MKATSKQRFHIPASLAIIGLSFLWGAGFPAIDIVVTQLPPLGAAGIRYAVSGCIVLGYAQMVTDRLLPKTIRELRSIGIVGGFMFGSYQAGLYLGTLYISGAIASVVTTMSPVVAALVAVPILGESRGLLDGIGFCLGLSGVLILSQPSVSTASLSSTALGVGLVFLGTILFAVGSVIFQLFDEDEELTAEVLQGWAMLVGAALLFCGGILRGESIPNVQSLSPIALASLLYITLIAGAGGYLLYFRLVRQVGATETTLVAYLEPVAATLVSVLLLNQTIDTTTIIGFLAVATGFTLVSRDTMRRAIARFQTTDSTTSSAHRTGNS
ncbi:DMT family transporter [Haladaptatus halobius]|uniref:DMT family transporter n=1 Tax=Haladaptatus halobius TaxID=2884875 RepID=UPI001D09AEB6|nr:EamA family transporter [Haladaptatus halobius]